MLTAFVQEFERRLGQKRKSHGGNSLETVAVFYLPKMSDTYKKCSGHIGMKNYVRPLNKFVSDIKKLTK